MDVRPQLHGRGPRAAGCLDGLQVRGRGGRGHLAQDGRDLEQLVDGPTTRVTFHDPDAASEGEFVSTDAEVTDDDADLDTTSVAGAGAGGEALSVTAAGLSPEDWPQLLQHWADRALAGGQNDLLEEATAAFERTLILSALRATDGQRQEAARRLGWGRNTLTRKIKELSLDV